MKKFLLGLCIIALIVPACSDTMNMRKISIEPKISTDSVKKSTARAGLLLNDEFTNYKYTFKTGTQIYLMAKVQGEIDVGKNLSQAIYGIVSNKFGNVVMGNNANDIRDIDFYFVPRMKSFKYEPPYTGLSSHVTTVELETDVIGADGKLLRTISVKQEGTRSMFNQLKMQTNYEMAAGSVNEAIDNVLQDFSQQLDKYY
ncbi:MAG TPA: hypothetical protein VLZ07_04655 [Syntrophales bacterium]|nr:hypothetical protein [Syntrophales bacterium]